MQDLVTWQVIRSCIHELLPLRPPLPQHPHSQLLWLSLHWWLVLLTLCYIPATSSGSVMRCNSDQSWGQRFSWQLAWRRWFSVRCGADRPGMGWTPFTAFATVKGGERCSLYMPAILALVFWLEFDGNLKQIVQIVIYGALKVQENKKQNALKLSFRFVVEVSDWHVFAVISLTFPRHSLDIPSTFPRHIPWHILDIVRLFSYFHWITHHISFAVHLSLSASFQSFRIAFCSQRGWVDWVALIHRCIMQKGFLLKKEQQSEKKKKASSQPSENALTFDIASWKMSTSSTAGADKFNVNVLEDDIGAGEPLRMTHIKTMSPGGSFTIKIDGGKVTMIPTEAEHS